MAVRIFQSAKTANFGGLFFQIVHLVLLGEQRILVKLSFYLLIHVKIT